MESPFFSVQSGSFANAKSLRMSLGVTERRMNGWLRGVSDNGRTATPLKAPLRHFDAGDAKIILSDWFLEFLRENADEVSSAQAEKRRK